MGIEGLGKLIDTECPDVRFKLRITDLIGRKVAIDGNYVAYKFMAVAVRSVVGKTNIALDDPDPEEVRAIFLASYIRWLLSFLCNNVTPIVCFDGEAPKYKDKTRRDRAEKKEEARDDAEELKESIRTENPLLVTKEHEDELKKLLRGTMSVRAEDIRALIRLLMSLGIPVLQADGEAERLACTLCYAGETVAVFSKDSDCLMYGVPLQLTDSFNSSSSFQFACIRTEDVLEGLKLNQEEFIDLGITCKCDYNERMPQVGPVRALQLIRQYRRIEDFPKTTKFRGTGQLELDTNLLNYEVCREIFTPCDLSKIEIQQLSVNRRVYLDIAGCMNARDLLERCGSLKYFDDIRSSVMDIRAGVTLRLDKAGE